MADCYYHGYSGGPGGCSQCEAENRSGEERGTRGMTLDSDLVMDMANKSSLGTTLWKKVKSEEFKKEKSFKNKRKK